MTIKKQQVENPIEKVINNIASAPLPKPIEEES